MRPLCLLLILVILGNAPAYAVTVIDPTNLVQNIQQVRQTIESVKKLTEQLQAAKAQLESLTGDRGMRKLVTDTTRAIIPKNWREALDSLGAEGTKIKGLVEGIRKDVGDIGSANLKFAPGKVSAELERSAKFDLDAWGRATTLYNTSNERFEKLEELGDALNGAGDVKAVLDLMARLQIESNMLLNELLRMMAEMVATDRERALNHGQRVQNEHAKAMSGF